MSNDLMERLRGGTGDGLRAYDWMNEAADCLEALGDRISALEAALENAVDENETQAKRIAELEAALNQAKQHFRADEPLKVFIEICAALVGGSVS